MVSEKDKTSDNNAKIIAGIVVVVIVLIAAAYFGGFFGQGTPTSPPGTQPANASSELQYASTKLLLSSYDSQAALNVYTIAYSINDNGAKTQYEVASNQTNSYVRVEEPSDTIQGFFGQDNSTNVICLTYVNETECAFVGQNATSVALASRLMGVEPAQSALQDQKTAATTLIEAGAIKMDPAITNQAVGPFDAKEVQYDLDYSNLTLQTLTALGISPSDIDLTRTNQHVELWIDSATGLIIQSHATYVSNGVPGFVDTNYTIAQPTATFPPLPTQGISTEAFVQFYQLAEQDYYAMANCASQSGQAQDTCYQTLAVNDNRYQTCKMITNESSYEHCTIIVAQNTGNAALCASLTLYPDDCYIAVASQTGNSSLCNNLINTSLNSTCLAAAAQGKQLQEQAVQAQEQLNASRNCNVSSDCKITGNANQFCVPVNSNITYSNSTSPEYSCLKGIPCTCQSGFCGFATNSTYDDCVNAVDQQGYEAYIEGLAQQQQANATNSTSGAQPANSSSNSTNSTSG